MLIEQIKTGGDRNFAYIVADAEGGEAAVIDPSYDPKRVFKRAQELGLTIRYVLNTHGHYDHSNGNAEMEQLAGVTAVGYGQNDPRTGHRIVDGVQLPLGELTIQVLHTPGHTDDSVCYYVDDAVITGDTLFVGKIGGTDLGKQAQTQFDSLREKLLVLPDSTRVFPGHDVGVQPESTIGHEKKTNPFLTRIDNFDDFLDLKKNWAEYKRKHGIA